MVAHKKKRSAWKQMVLFCLLGIPLMSTPAYTQAVSSWVVTPDQDISIPLQMKTDHLRGDLVRIIYKALTDTRKNPYLIQVIMGGISTLKSGDESQINDLNQRTIGLIAHYFPLRKNQTGEVILRLLPALTSKSDPSKLSFKMIAVHPDGHVKNAAIEIMSVTLIAN